MWHISCTYAHNHIWTVFFEHYVTWTIKLNTCYGLIYFVVCSLWKVTKQNFFVVMEALLSDSPIVPGLLTEYILKGENKGYKNKTSLSNSVWPTVKYVFNLVSNWLLVFCQWTGLGTDSWPTDFPGGGSCSSNLPKVACCILWFPENWHVCLITDNIIWST